MDHARNPLDPFKKSDGTAYTSRDVVNVETQLGYTYGRGSFSDDSGHPHQAMAPGLMGEEQLAPTKGVITVSGTNRGMIPGSYVIEVTRELPSGEIFTLGSEAILSRWHTSGCANCQTHLAVTATIPLPGIDEETVRNEYMPDNTEKSKISVNVRTRKLKGNHPLDAAPTPIPAGTIHFPTFVSPA